MQPLLLFWAETQPQGPSWTGQTVRSECGANNMRGLVKMGTTGGSTHGG